MNSIVVRCDTACELKQDSSSTLLKTDVTVIHWNNLHGRQLTADWKSGKCHAVCRHVELSERRVV